MNDAIRRITAAAAVNLLVFLPVTQVLAESQAEKAAEPPAALRDVLQKSYPDLFELAPGLYVDAAEVQRTRDILDRGEKACRRSFRDHANVYGKQIEAARKSLKEGGPDLAEPERHVLHCKIQNLDLLRSEANVLSEHAIPNAYDNLNAKLDLLRQWPVEYARTVSQISDGSYAQRQWGDVKDIGFREIAPGQRDDIKRGQQAVEEMRRTGLMPPALENKPINDYVNAIAQRVAQHSDLHVPLHLTILDSREINAFALPGGYMFIERGLLEAAEDESELAGVIAHELAHVTARHSAKLMKRATIASIFFQAAQVAAMVLTGGVAGIGMYYALQYGFYGLGLVLDLKLLGVSRDYELEADQLGVQYAWAAGYDTTGFMRFFDKIATKEGYVNGVSWFRTHPPFYQRMVRTQQEIMFLPKQTERTVQTSEFLAMKETLKPIAAEAEKNDPEKPSLLRPHEESCKAPDKLKYKAGQPIEQLCSMPARTLDIAALQIVASRPDLDQSEPEEALFAADPALQRSSCNAQWR